MQKNIKLALVLTIIISIGVLLTYVFVFKKNLSTPTQQSGKIIDNDNVNINGWQEYKNNAYGASIKYPPGISIKEVTPGKSDEPLREIVLILFTSQEVGPNVQIPPGQEEYKKFHSRYFSAGLSIYDNFNNLALKDALKTIFSQNSIIPGKTTYDLMEDRLQPFKKAPKGSFLFEGAIGENPVKKIFIPHNTKLYIFTLYGGPYTDESYSTNAETLFDDMISTFQFSQNKP